MLFAQFCHEQSLQGSFWGVRHNCWQHKQLQRQELFAYSTECKRGSNLKSWVLRLADTEEVFEKDIYWIVYEWYHPVGKWFSAVVRDYFAGRCSQKCSYVAIEND